MSEINNGGPAFPSHGTMGEVTHEGMTLRDRFAIAALPQLQFSHHDEYTLDAIATLAYQQADAMIRARGAA
ncbi:gp38 [Pandoraea captiosa]|uniref:Gp38 n=1 Tax=Pandoraea captiosa TaxID=2508302 RepID=A0A5E5ANV8_9BURK|nr:hypothetical protein [Pandoraea captiosa]VVE74203.1 gp38 [Pandoraea captiosa]